MINAEHKDRLFCFIISNTMSIYEQRFTYNPNMPLRELMYTAKLYDKYMPGSSTRYAEVPGTCP